MSPHNLHIISECDFFKNGSVDRGECYIDPIENKYLQDMTMSFDTEPNKYIKNDRMKVLNSEEPIEISDDENYNIGFQPTHYTYPDLSINQTELNQCLERMMSMTDSYELLSSEDRSCDRRYTNFLCRVHSYPNDFKMPCGHDALQMSLYGFYWTGVADSMRCFSRKITLYDWKEDDSPLFEHIKNSSCCNYLHYTMGINYFQKIQNFTQNRRRNSSLSVTNTLVNILKDEKKPIVPPLSTALSVSIRSGTSISKEKTSNAYKLDDENITIDHIYKDQQMRFLMESKMFTAENLLIYTILYKEELKINIKDFFENLEVEKFIDFTQDLMKDQPKTENDDLQLTPSAPNLKSSPPPPPPVSNNLCSCCMERERNVLILPCNHVCTCFECATYIRNKGNKKCPVCRHYIKGVTKIFL